MDQEKVRDFMKAVMYNHIDTVRTMLYETPQLVNEKNRDGDTALHWASNYGHYTIVQLLLDKGANVHTKDKWGRTALYLTSNNGHIAIAKLLLDAGADIQCVDNRGQTALDVAKNDGMRQLLRHPTQRQRAATAPSLAAAAPDIPLAAPAIPAVAQTVPSRLESPAIDAIEAPKPESTAFSVIDFSDLVISNRVSVSAFSSVYRGTYRTTDVAIKMLRGDGTVQLSATDLHLPEITILSKLRHPRIVTLLGVVMDVDDRFEAQVALVTEFMSRGSLFHVLHRDVRQSSATPLPEHRLSTLSSKLRVMRDVADGMKFLHNSNVIHRDLKSPNVLLDEDGRAKICDFGVSKLLPPNISYATTIAGTPAWSSPEALLEVPNGINRSTDVYSFGVILWEILTERIPWSGVAPLKAALSVSRGESVSIDAARAVRGVPSELIDLLEWCLQLSPNARPTFDIVSEQLSAILNVCAERENAAIRLVSCPDCYICPISHEIMKDPVICSDGHSYERTYIERWLQEHDTSPNTNVPLETKELRPNINLRQVIREFLELNPHV